MPDPIANARMYSVTPDIRDHWKRLLSWILEYAGLNWPILDYEAPAPMSLLWARQDLGATLMCGLPFSHREPPAIPIAAPIPSPDRYGGKSVYFTDIVVRSDSSARTLEDTFGGTIGYTVPDSFSGAVALAQHLQPLRLAAGKPLYRNVVGGLVHARGVIHALSEGRIDVGPLDSYYHDLLRAADPAFAAGVRVVATTSSHPLPLFAATADLEPAVHERLRAAFAASGKAQELVSIRSSLLLKGFAFPESRDYEVLKTFPRSLEFPSDAF